ncbi:MAG: AraC family transcriptional regulator [Sulfurospirillaceae bacterium]|nr:AraC family transcriptional regulator [Sulfurospirillaceae bacterium]MDD2825581.1 AraC family transcriptional regulator [Sulfurospirillaceae bacterium]
MQTNTTIESLLEALVELLNNEKLHEGLNATPIAHLNIFKASSLSEMMHTVYEPSLFIIVQGAKVVMLGQNSYQYDATSYLVSSLHLPVTGKIIEACEQKPFLSLQLIFEPEQIVEMMQYTTDLQTPSKNGVSSIGVGHTTVELLDASFRLVCLWHQKEAITALAPLIIKEILYRVLQGEYGVMLHQFVLKGSNAYRIAKSIEYISQELATPLRVNELCKKVGMSVASFHRHFKNTTTMSPIQYQKLLRLQQARQLLLGEIGEVAEAAFLVGYESPSQFSREYSRVFGNAPSLDIKLMKQNLMRIS